MFLLSVTPNMATQSFDESQSVVFSFANDDIKNHCPWSYLRVDLPVVLQC